MAIDAVNGQFWLQIISRNVWKFVIFLISLPTSDGDIAAIVEFRRLMLLFLLIHFDFALDFFPQYY